MMEIYELSSHLGYPQILEVTAYTDEATSPDLGGDCLYKPGFVIAYT